MFSDGHVDFLSEYQGQNAEIKTCVRFFKKGLRVESAVCIHSSSIRVCVCLYIPVCPCLCLYISVFVSSVLILGGSTKQVSLSASGITSTHSVQICAPSLV